MIVNFFMASVIMLGSAAQASPELAQKRGCMVCHAADRRVVGPAFREVAQKYQGQPATDLARSIRQGGSGRWGPVPMPAQPAVTEAESLALARWIMGQR